MDPTEPSQPTLNQAYNTAGNPADQTPQEQVSSSANASSNSGSIVEQREQGDIPVPSTHDGSATASSLGHGVRDASQDKGDSPQMGASVSDVEGEQMRAAGEGDIYRAQFNKSGFGEQGDFANDLDTKKAEQAGKRDEVKSQRQEAVDVGGALGGRTGPSAVEGRPGF